MFKEYLNKKCYVTVSLASDANGGSETLYGLITNITDRVITMEVEYISVGLRWRTSKHKNTKFGKTTINVNYLIMISEEI